MENVAERRVSYIQIENHECWINHCSNVATTMPIDVFTSVPPLVKHTYWSQIGAARFCVFAIQCCYLDYCLLQSSSDVIAAGGYCRRFIMRPDVAVSVHSKRRLYRFEIFSFQNYLDIPNIDGSVLNCSIAVANALETPQSFTKPSICVPG